MLRPIRRVLVIVLGPIWGALVIMAGAVLVIMLGRIWGVFVVMLGPKSITRWRNLGRRNHLQTKKALARFLGAKGLEHNY